MTTDSRMEMRDLLTDLAFSLRQTRDRKPDRESQALRRLSRLVAENPESVLQELVNTAVDLCGADSAGISLEEPDAGTFRWIVIAGSFEPYLDGRTPRNYSPCGTCLDSGRPQLYRVTQPYYDHLGVKAKPISDGILIPWKNEFFNGTLWAVSHRSDEAFTTEDYRLLSSLADFSSIIVRQQHQQKLLMQAEHMRGTAEMAHDLAHQINNPLQSLTNTLYLARRGREDDQMLAFAEADLHRLSELVANLLQISAPSSRGGPTESGKKRTISSASRSKTAAAQRKRRVKAK